MKRLAIAFLALCLNPVLSIAQQHIELVINGDAEAAAGGDGTTTVAAPSWTVGSTVSDCNACPICVPVGFTVAHYGASGNFLPQPSTPGPLERGSNFFCGGEVTGATSASQWKDLASYQSALSTGAVKCSLSAWLGGSLDQPDHAWVEATFYDQAMTALTAVQVGPVTNVDRTDLTQLLFRDAVITVPATARWVEVRIEMRRFVPCFLNGYADNVSLKLLDMPQAYCTAKVNSDLCRPVIEYIGYPSLSAGAGFRVKAREILANKSGILYYGTSGPLSSPWCGGFQCVKAPVQRTGIQNSGGGSPCSGVFDLDWTAWVTVNAPGSVPAGSIVNAQYWYRDPLAQCTTGLTNGLQFAVAP